MNEQEQNVDEIMNALKELESGNPPLIIKVLTGEANKEELTEWRQQNGILEEEQDNVISMLQTSFTTGAETAEKITKELDMLNQETTSINNKIKCIKPCNNELYKRLIIDRLDIIINQLDKLKDDVGQILFEINACSICL